MEGGQEKEKDKSCMTMHRLLSIYEEENICHMMVHTCVLSKF